MANVTAQMVKELRDKTGAGMMDCKAALGETQGDLESAVDWLRKKGLSKAAKKAGRIAAEGLIGVAVAGKKGVVVEVNSETDFVARNEQFQGLVRMIAGIALDVGTDIERHLGHHLDQPLEQVVAGDEIGFRIDLDQHALGARDLDGDQALGRDAAGLLGGLGEALLAQPIDGRLHVALGLAERGLAIHHARSGHLAQLLDHRSGDLFRHRHKSSINSLD